MATETSDDDEYEPEYEPEEVTLAGRTLRVLALVPPPLEYMSALHSKSQEISGRQVWTGSALLAHLLSQNETERERLQGAQRILELGTGTGILGMVVSKIAPSARVVVLTDGDDEALGLLEENLRDSFNRLDPDQTKATKLYWGDEASLNALEGWCRASWSDDEKSYWPEGSGVQFDCIIAGDVMYKAELPRLFFDTVSRLLAPSGTLWLCHVPRACVDQETVQAAAALVGLEFVVLDTHNVSVDACPVEDLSRARVYRMQRRRALENPA